MFSCFVMLEQSASELLALEPIQLMAEDDMSFKQWTTIFKDIFRLYRELNSAQESDQSMR